MNVVTSHSTRTLVVRFARGESLIESIATLARDHGVAAATLVGQEAGLHLTQADGTPLDAPFDTQTSCDWIGYANAQIRAEVEPVLQRLLHKRGWLGKS